MAVVIDVGLTVYPHTLVGSEIFRAVGVVGDVQYTIGGGVAGDVVIHGYLDERLLATLRIGILIGGEFTADAVRIHRRHRVVFRLRPVLLERQHTGVQTCLSHTEGLHFLALESVPDREAASSDTRATPIPRNTRISIMTTMIAEPDSGPRSGGLASCRDPLLVVWNRLHMVAPNPSTGGGFSAGLSNSARELPVSGPRRCRP